MRLQEFAILAKTTFRKWLSHKAPFRAAALSFFTIFPFPSLLLITIAVLSQVLGQAEAFKVVIQQVTAVAGSAVAGLVGQLLQSIRNPFTSLFVAIVSIVFTFAGAIGAFGVLQDSMNTIWETEPPKHKNITERVTYNIIPFFIVSVLAIIVVIWATITSVSYSFIAIIFRSSHEVSVLLATTSIVLSFFLATGLFAIIYKAVPDTKIAWKDVILAAVITAVLFVFSNYIFEIYIQVFSGTSYYGAAGSVMLLLLWIYLMTQFLLFGAEFSKTYAETMGSRKLFKPASELQVS